MATPVVMPKLGLTMEVGRLVAWHKAEGDAIERGEVLAEVQTDKIAAEIESPAAGTVLKLLASPDEELTVQTLIAVIGAPGEDIAELLAAPPLEVGAAPAAPRPAEGVEPRAAGAAGKGLRITPRARKFMKEHGIAASELEGLGKARINEGDVRAYMEQRAAAPPAAEAEDLVPLTPAQKVAAQRLTQSFRDVPQFSLRFSVRMERALATQRTEAERLGRKITVNDVLLRAVAMALAREPGVQTQFTESGLRRPKVVNLGVAVSGHGGLIVPVIHDAAGKSLAEISAAAADMVERARAGRLGPDDVVGGTFTVSNLGMFGITSFVPIVNPGEGAILGAGAVQESPAIVNSGLAVRRVMELTLVGDHRAFDGATGAQFCRTLKQILEEEDLA